MDLGLTLSEEDALKAQIFGCWVYYWDFNENLLVRIKLKLKPDGTIITLKYWIMQE